MWAAVAIFPAVTAWLSFFPARALPAHVDAIAMLEDLVTPAVPHRQHGAARLRLERCFAGHIYVVTAPLPAGRGLTKSLTSGERH